MTKLITITVRLNICIYLYITGKWHWFTDTNYEALPNV